jgi:hypothetical protein
VTFLQVVRTSFGPTASTTSVQGATVAVDVVVARVRMRAHGLDLGPVSSVRPSLQGGAHTGVA